MTTGEVKEAKIERAEGQKLGMALRNVDGNLCVTKVSDGGAVKVRLKSSFFSLDLMIILIRNRPLNKLNEVN